MGLSYFGLRIADFGFEKAKNIGYRDWFTVSSMKMRRGLVKKL